MLKEKVVVITGGGGLLGRRFCSAAANRGAVVVVADIDIEAAMRLAVSIRDSGGKAEPVHLDISSPDSVDGVVAKLHRSYGRIDAVVNNAYPRNARYGRKLEEVEYADFAENVTANLAGYFLVSQQFAKYFVERGSGNIVNIASIYGVIAPRFDVYRDTKMTMPVEYAAIKAGVVHLTRYFAQYFKQSGIRCNALSPGGILDRQPMPFLQAYKTYSGTKGMLTPDDIEGALMFLLSDESRYVTGQNLIVDDGFSL